MSLAEKCGQIRLLLSDVDGVLTDGLVTIDNQGVESKQFHIRDGQGIRLWQHAGGQFGIVTGRSSQVVKLRAAELDIEILRQGVKDKWPTVQEICEQTGIPSECVCYVGDDLPDLATIEQVGLGVAVADAAEEVRQAADYVTQIAGGQGAIREIVELVLKTSNRWDAAFRKYAA